EEKFTYRSVRIEHWPADVHPVEWLLKTMHTQLKLDSGSEAAPHVPFGADTAPALAENTGLEPWKDRIDRGLELATLRSEHPVLIYLDQIEQLLIVSRYEQRTTDLFKWQVEQVVLPRRFHQRVESLLKCVHYIAQSRMQGLKLVLAIREDYLGR